MSQCNACEGPGDFVADLERELDGRLWQVHICESAQCGIWFLVELCKRCESELIWQGADCNIFNGGDCVEG
jgi:hypothetical protein